jgi:sigma-B regulation protein RsbU (phosphoserine phosphatase)
MTLKILVVDDEPDVPLLVRQRFRKEIQEKQMEFRFAGNGVEALEALDREPDIGIVLTDINMPEMDGLTLLSTLTGRGPLPKAVIVSAYGDMDNIRVAMNRGAFDFVTKPIDFRDLQTTIEKTNQELLLLRKAFETRDELVGLRRELSIATLIQRSLLPRELPGHGADRRFDVFATMVPAREIGGDFYDYIRIDDHRVGFVVADVSGKGVGAAIYMAVSRTILRTVAVEGGHPGDCLRRLNTLLCADNDAGMFVTVWYGILDLETGELQYASGGHPPPFVVADGGVRMFDMNGDMIVGLMEGEAYRVRRDRLAPGEYLVLYSDGVSEAMNEADECFSVEQLGEVLNQAPRESCRSIADAIFEAVTAHQGTARQSDDITILALRYVGPPA